MDILNCILLVWQRSYCKGMLRDVYFVNKFYILQGTVCVVTFFQHQKQNFAINVNCKIYHFNFPSPDCLCNINLSFCPLSKVICEWVLKLFLIFLEISSVAHLFMCHYKHAYERGIIAMVFIIKWYYIIHYIHLLNIIK